MTQRADDERLGPHCVTYEERASINRLRAYRPEPVRAYSMLPLVRLVV